MNARNAMADVPDSELWTKRLIAARTRREEFEDLWAEYARLHTNAYIASQDVNDDPAVLLPSGDQVKLGLIHANVEQTLAQLEIAEPVVTAAARDFTRPMDATDVQREAVVGAALSQSIELSGLVSGRSVADMAKLYGVIAGHGVIFTTWAKIEDERTVGYAPRLMLAADGLLDEVLDDDGELVYEPLTEVETLYEGCFDEAISPTCFLLDAEADTIQAARWLGHEQIVPLTDLRADGRFSIPDEVTGGTFTRKDLYGEDGKSEYQVEDSVCLITVWDRRTRRLLRFIEHQSADAVTVARGADPRTAKAAETDLLLVADDVLPLRWDHPDDSPYNAFVPIPAAHQPFGISQVEHTKRLSAEADKLRTRSANHARQEKRIILYDKRGGVAQDQIDQARTAPDFAFIGLDVNSDDPNALSRMFSELPTPRLNSDLFAAEQRAAVDIDKVSGVSAVPAGGAETATEANNIMAIGGARTERKRRLYLGLLQRVARVHKAFLSAWADDGMVAVVRDPNGMPVPVVYGREAFRGRFDLRVAAGGESFNVTPVEMKALTELTPLVVQVAQVVGDPMLARRWLRHVMMKVGTPQVDNLLGYGQAPAAAMGGGLPSPALAGPGGVDGRLRQERLVIGDQSQGQALRAGVNALMEGGGFSRGG